jgi:hypothetical protein
LAGRLIWKIQTNLTFGSLLRAWSASSWLNDKTVLIIDGTYPGKELDRIRNTLSVKENGEDYIRSTIDHTLRVGKRTQNQGCKYQK